MTQFASTLYPQKNPTNPILLEFRLIYHEKPPVFYEGYWQFAKIWLELLDEDPGMQEARNWGQLCQMVTIKQIKHARRVLERLARFSD